MKLCSKFEEILWRHSVMFFCADPNILIPIGSLFGCVMVFFIISVIIYYMFKVDIVLCFRRVFPVLYTNKGSISQKACNQSHVSRDNIKNTVTTLTNPQWCFDLATQPHNLNLYVIPDCSTGQGNKLTTGLSAPFSISVSLTDFATEHFNVPDCILTTALS